MGCLDFAGFSAAGFVESCSGSRIAAQRVVAVARMPKCFRKQTACSCSGAPVPRPKTTEPKMNKLNLCTRSPLCFNLISQARKSRRKPKLLNYRETSWSGLPRWLRPLCLGHQRREDGTLLRPTSGSLKRGLSFLQ